MNDIQFRGLIVQPALKAINMWSTQAEELLMGTAAQESGMMTYIRQVIDGSNRFVFGSVGGFGAFQMENDTFMDLWNRHIKSKPLELEVMGFCNFDVEPSIYDLMINPRFAAIMCRLKYLDAPEALPASNYVPGIASYWKKYYNTLKGAGTEQEFIDNYKRYVTQPNAV